MWPRASRTTSGSCSSTTSGPGGSDISAYDPSSYTLARRLRRRRPRASVGTLDLRDVIFVGHSVSAMIGVAGRSRGARSVRQAGAGRPLAALHRRRRLRRRLHRGRHRRAARLAREQLPRMVQRHGTGDHGQPRPPRARRGAHGQLLPDRSRDRPAVRPGHVPLRQPGRPGPGVARPTLVLQCANDAIAPVAVGDYVSDALPDSSFVLLDATGHCPQPERARRRRPPPSPHSSVGDCPARR